MTCDISLNILSREISLQPRMNGTPSMKINKLIPNLTDFDLLFELIQIIGKDQGILRCRIVDDTGIVNAIFNTYIDKLEAGIVYHMTHLKTELNDGSLQVVMSKQTSTTKEPDTLGFKDKANDISKKKFDPSLIASIKTPILDEAPKKEETLIPFTKEQAEEQLKLKRNFDKQMNNNHRRASDFKPNQPNRNEEKNQNQNQNNKFKPKQQNNQNNSNKYADKNQQKHNDYDLKPKYKEKVEYQEKTKKEYREKDNNQRDKTKSLVYKPKY